MAVVQSAYLTRHVGGAVHMLVFVFIHGVRTCVCVCDAQNNQMVLRLQDSASLRAYVHQRNHEFSVLCASLAGRLTH